MEENSLQLHDLEYFIKLAELKNFTKVAQYFNVSQPTITYAIKRIETAVGGTLISRNQSHHAIELSKDGTQFLLHAQNMLTEFNVAKAEIQSNHKARIKLGLPPIIGSHFFPKFIPQLSRANLIRDLETTSAGSDELLQRLLDGALNLTFLGSSRYLDNSQLKLNLLAEYNFSIIVSTSHYLAERKEVFFDELTDQPFIALDEPFVHNGVFDYVMNHQRKSPKVIYRTADVAIVKQMVAQNAGVALIADLAVSDTDNLKVLRLREPVLPSFKVFLAHRRDYLPTDMENVFMRVVAQKYEAEDNAPRE